MSFYFTPEKLARIKGNWPHQEPFAVRNGLCFVCGYDYRNPDSPPHEGSES